MVVVAEYDYRQPISARFLGASHSTKKKEKIYTPKYRRARFGEYRANE